MYLDWLEITKESLKETLWPTRCAICDKHGRLLCKECMRKLKIIDNNKSCDICGEPYGINQCCSCTKINEDNLNDNINQKYYNKAKSFCLLDKNSGRLITLYKDSGDRELSWVIAYFISCLIPASLHNKSNVYITYIPSSEEAKTKRGFDHCELIASNLSKITKIKYIKTIEVKKTNDQRDLTRKERELNIYNKFKFSDNIKDIKQPDKSTVILIDDVYTTGATLNAASKELKKSGFKKVFCITFSRTF